MLWGLYLILSLTRSRLALRPRIPTLLPNEYIGEKGARDWGQLSILRTRTTHTNPGWTYSATVLSLAFSLGSVTVVSKLSF